MTVKTKEFLVQHCILTAFSFWVNKEDWLDKFTTKKKSVHLRWSWHCLFLLKRWWTWLSETRSRGGGGSAAQFFSEKWGKIPYFFAFWRVSRHPQPRAPFSKSPPRPRQIKGPELRPAASTLGLWNASWPGLWLWKLCPGPGVSAGQQMYVCIVEIECLKILFLYIGQWIFAVVIFIKFLKLFRYSGEKVAQMG